VRLGLAVVAVHIKLTSFFSARHFVGAIAHWEVLGETAGAYKDWLLRRLNLDGGSSDVTNDAGHGVLSNVLLRSQVFLCKQTEPFTEEDLPRKVVVIHANGNRWMFTAQHNWIRKANVEFRAQKIQARAAQALLFAELHDDQVCLSEGVLAAPKNVPSCIRIREDHPNDGVVA
jgi:hypothetical protein